MNRNELSIQTGPFGTQLKASDYVESGTPVINVRNIGFGIIIDENIEYITDETRDKLSSHILRKDDIVFGRKGAVERHAFVDEKHDGWFQGSDCIRIRIESPHLRPRYVSYCLLTPAHKTWMANNCSHGATMASLNQDIVKRIEIPVPELSSQDQVISTLSTYDDLIENNNRRIAVLEEMAQKLYREWFVHFRFPGHENVKMVESEMGLIPTGWEVVDVKEVVFRCKNGTVYRDSDVAGAGTVPVIDQSTNDVLGYHNNNPDFKATVESPIAIFGDHTCKMQLNVRPFSIGSNVVAFVSSKNHSMTFVFYSVKNLIETREYKRHWNDFMKKSIIIPRENQEKAFSNVLASFLEQIEILKQKNTNLRKTRDLLLPRLISGDIDVSELDIPTKEG